MGVAYPDSGQHEMAGSTLSFGSAAGCRDAEEASMTRLATKRAFGTLLITVLVMPLLAGLLAAQEAPAA